MQQRIFFLDRIVKKRVDELELKVGLLKIINQRFVSLFSPLIDHEMEHWKF